MTMVYVERVSDGALYRVCKNGAADFGKTGTVVMMSRDVAEMWTRHAKFPIRLLGVTK